MDVEANAYWATTAERAGARLDELIAAGLDEINYSTGDEHVRFVPLERVVHATVAALERGLKVHVMVELRKERRVTQEDLLEHPEIAALDPEVRKPLHVSESPWMPLDPRNVETYPEGVATDAGNVGMRTGCDSILQVPPDQNLPGIEAAFDAAPTRDVVVRRFAGLNHLLQAAKTGSPLEYAAIEETIHPEVLEVIAGWLVDRFAKR